MEINKQLITKRFTAALTHYDSEATPQQEIAKQLIGLWQQQNTITDSSPSNVLEIGCGTGLFSKLLQQALPKNNNITMIDLCAEVEPLLREKVGDSPHFIVGDAEEIEWGKPNYDLITSASCIQWWQNPATFFTKAYRYCIPGGTLLFSTFGPNNMHQIRKVFGIGLHYASIIEVEKSLINVGWKIGKLQEYNTTLYRPSLPSLLNHIKKTGVNGLPITERLTPNGIKKYEHIYRTLFALTSNDLPLTYHALLCIAYKH